MKELNAMQEIESSSRIFTQGLCGSQLMLVAYLVLGPRRASDYTSGRASDTLLLMLLMDNED